MAEMARPALQVRRVERETLAAEELAEQQQLAVAAVVAAQVDLAALVKMVAALLITVVVVAAVRVAAVRQWVLRGMLLTVAAPVVLDLQVQAEAQVLQKMVELHRRVQMVAAVVEWAAMPRAPRELVDQDRILRRAPVPVVAAVVVGADRTQIETAPSAVAMAEVVVEAAKAGRVLLVVPAFALSLTPLSNLLRAAEFF